MTEIEYFKLLERIKTENPGEVLLPLLKKGYSTLNVIYMKTASTRLSEKKPTPTQAPAAKAQAAPDPLRTLWAERTRLFGLMNKQANEFHKCKNNTERAENSVKVRAYWSDILAVKAKIKHFEQYGEMPVEEIQGDKLPDNPALLAKRINVLRVSISTCKKTLEQLMTIEHQPGTQAKMMNQEERLKKFKYLLGIAEQKQRQNETT